MPDGAYIDTAPRLTTGTAWLISCETLLRSLAENTTELVIMGPPPAEADVVAETFMDNPLVMIDQPGHPPTGKKLKNGMELVSKVAIKQSVQAGLGTGRLSRATLNQELELRRLVVLDMADFPILRRRYLVHAGASRS